MATADTHAALRCVVVTPERAVLDEPADFVVVPMSDGELGVAHGRLPLIGRARATASCRIRRWRRTVHHYYVDGGFVQVRADVVTVLTGRALKAEDINVPADGGALHAVGGAGRRRPACPCPVRQGRGSGLHDRLLVVEGRRTAVRPAAGAGHRTISPSV